MSQCNPNPCHNNGTCQDASDGHFCICSKSWTGSLCETGKTMNWHSMLAQYDVGWYHVILFTYRNRFVWSISMLEWRAMSSAIWRHLLWLHERIHWTKMRDWDHGMCFHAMSAPRLMHRRHRSIWMPLHSQVYRPDVWIRYICVLDLPNQLGL